MASADDPRFRISFSRELGDRLRVWARRAAELGFGEEYLAAVRMINRRLTTDPLGWGDPRFRMRHLDLLICHGMYEFLHADFAVDERRRVVYIRDIRPLPGHRLEEGE